MSDNLCIVVGSGPAGTATAVALLQRGMQVIMLDAGYRLETHRQVRVHEISKKKPHLWTEEDIAFLKGEINISHKGVKEKKVFGSSFANKENAYCPIQKQGAQFYLSFANGGLSNLWGRGILPLAQEDQVSWPISIDEMDKYYRKVLEFVPIAGFRDNLEAIYPLFSRNKQSYRLSNQTRQMLENLGENKDYLQKAGVHFGTTRLAADLDDCDYCGMCMYGCPYDRLYCSSQTLKKLEKNPKFQYKSGYVANSFEEAGSKVFVNSIEDKSGKKVIFEGGKVFLSAGSISTTGIVLRSMRGKLDRVLLKCSDLYYIPAITIKGAGNVFNEDLMTLSQLMLEIKDPKISTNYISVHCHGYNDLFMQLLQNLAGPLEKIANPFIKSFLNRFFVLFCFLHSDHSDQMLCRLNGNGQLMVSGVQNVESEAVYKKVRHKLFSLWKKTGLLPFPLYSKKRLPGTSMHFGASFPMSKNPSQNQSDIMGRISPFKHVHVTDATVLPSIPAGSYTLTIMANAFRIAKEC